MGESIVHIRKQIERDVFDYPTLTRALAGYRKPRDKITRLLAERSIIRVRKGLYCFGEDFRKEPVSREYLANLLYGPSYVRLEYALSFHGLIPERVEIVTSVTLKRSRVFRNPFGVFSYRQLADDHFASGAILQPSGTVTFLIATAEKALIDKAWSDGRSGSTRKADPEAYLIEDLRIEPDALSRLDVARLNSLGRFFHSAWIDAIAEWIGHLKGLPHA